MTSNTFITFNVYSCCNWCLSQLNAERMILINGDLKKIFAGGITYEKVIQKNRCFYYGSISNCSWSSQHDGKVLIVRQSQNPSEAVLKQLYMLTVVMHMEQQHVLVKIVLFL